MFGKSTTIVKIALKQSQDVGTVDPEGIKEKPQNIIGAKYKKN